MSLPNPMDNITLPDWTNISNAFNFTQMMNNGLLWTGFSPYLMIGDFFWALLLGVFLFALWSENHNPLLVIGYLFAVTVLTAAVIPDLLNTILVIVLAICIAAVLYYTFVRTQKDKEEAEK